MENYNTCTLGLCYNSILSELSRLKSNLSSVKDALNRRLLDDKSAVDTANRKIEDENAWNEKAGDALRDVWSVIWNDWSRIYNDTELNRLRREPEAYKGQKTRVEKEKGEYESKLREWKSRYSDFYDARKAWRSLSSCDGYYSSCIADWAVQARVKVVVARKNFVIRYGRKHPGIEYLREEKMAASIYNIYYKIFHPEKYLSIAKKLREAPRIWNNYIKATEALERASRNLGYNYLLTSSTAPEREISKLDAKIRELGNDIYRTSKNYDYANGIKKILSESGSLEGFFKEYNLDKVADNRGMRKGIADTISKQLGVSEAERISSISLNPLSFYCKINDSRYSNSETQQATELRKKVADCEKMLSEGEKRYRDIVDKLKMQYPLLLALHPSLGIDVDIKNIAKEQHYQKTLPCLVGAWLSNGDEQFKEWQTLDVKNRHKYNYNLRPLDGDYSSSNVTAVLNSVVGMIIGSFKPGNMKVTFVDLEMKGYHKKLFSGLIDSGIASCIISKADLTAKVNELQRKRSKIYNSLVGGDDLYEVYTSGKSEPDYELMVVFNSEQVVCDDNFQELITKGPDYGISVFGLSLGGDGRKDVVTVTDMLTSLYIDTKPLKDSNGNVVMTALENICKIAENNYKREVEGGIHWDEVDKLISEFPNKLRSNKKVWADAVDGLSVPIGRRVDGSSLDYYAFNPERSQHLSLVIGSTGSGKSVFLHNIITNLILKYSPDQVHLHLMDFKSSGLELKDYEGAPHVHTLLLDGEDLDMAAAILRNLKGEIGVISRKLGRYKNIMDYNKNNPGNPLPYNIFIVDECQELFRNSSNTPKAVDEIREIIGYIAQQGRATGFGFILATQTRIGLQFPRNAESQLNNVFMLKCSAEDAQNLFPNDKIEVPKYHVYHKDANNHGALSKVFINKKSVVVNGKETDCLYTQILREKGVFNFKGQFCYDSGQVREISENIVRKGYSNTDAQSPVLTLGHRLDVEYSNMPVELSFNSMNGNLLVSGINKEGQTDRIMLNSLCGLSKLNPSNAKVYVLNGNTSGVFSANLKKQINRFGQQRKCVFKVAAGQPQNKDLISELYNEFLRRKAHGRMGDDNVSYQPIVVAVMNSDRLITSLYESDKFTVAKSDNQSSNSTRTSMNTEESNLLARIKGHSTQTAVDSASSGPFKKFDSMANFGNLPATANEEISYGAAYAQLLANGSVYHIHFIIQKNTASSQFVPDFASRYIRSKADEIFMTRIMVARNDMSLERTSVMLDCNIDHLRAYYQEVGMEPEVMVPYVVSQADGVF